MKKTQRLDKILANMGFGSRKHIKSLVKNGAVTVNGKEAKDSSIHVDPFADIIDVNGERLSYREFIYLMMNKTQGVISATEDVRLKTVIDLLDDDYRHFQPFPVGRLDRDTEGLLLLTNDGKLAHDLLSPKKHVPKTYFALVDGQVTEQDREAFRHGVALDDGYITLPAELTILTSASESRIELTIREGKFHQVKRMFEAVGKKVTFLKRVSMGGLLLDERLKPGEYRELTEAELTTLGVER